MDKSKALMAFKDQGIQWFLNTLSELGASTMKEHISHFLSDGLSEIASDATTSTIPGLYGVVQGYKLRRYRENTMKYIDAISLKVDEIQYNMENNWGNYEEKINKLHGIVMDYIENERQVDKVEFFVNGFVNITTHDPDSLSEDFVLTYYNLLNSLSMVDIAVLRDIYFTRTKSFYEVVDEYSIRHDQYKSVQNNLFRLGLLTTKTEQESTSDLEKLFDSVNGIINHIKDYNSKFENILKGKKKRLPELKEKNIKMKSKERFGISKFGSDFVRFFLYTSENL
ncbi:hypothetical protein [Virgibacillus alimentarius]|uniref:hypothetical protein n=1 Tax=Virgibacillus alimentarius TaxID=698769 RepID=UPI000B146945|nr:hypothetical protein [Virgibacillus alimentarius]